jgi:hypothetical protein
MNRRDALMGLLFGGGMLGLRSVASGLPAALIANPRKALADVPATCATASRAQYVIFNTSAQGDPISNNAPGTYLDSNIVHPKDPQMAPTSITVGGTSWQAATPWATLGATLQRTTFFHLMTNTPIHPKEHDVLQLMGVAKNNEMFPSLIAQAMAPCLGTLQPQPVSVGGSTGETLTYGGAALPTIPPTALAATLKATAAANLTLLRDQTLDTIMGVYKNGASAAQKQYIDSLVTSTQQVRGIDQSVLGSITALKDNSVASQIAAAIALVKMKVSPVIALHIPFGSDNHSDTNLATETSETLTGMASLVSLFQQLASAGLQDQVSFVSLNVFGRTMGPATANGRNHNANHQLSLAIGKPFASAVIGGVGPVAGDYGATAIGDIAATDTLGAFAQSTLAALGADPQWIASNITAGKIVQAMSA